jgi:hypothetical protein
VIWTFLPSNVAGRTKKSVTASLLFIAYCVGNAVGAQVMQDKDAPRYIPGITVCAAMYGTEFTLMGLWRTYCKDLSPSLRFFLLMHKADSWQNKRRARMIEEMGVSPEEAIMRGKMNAEANMTDYENIYFKYQI